ncbi:hypothetical protein KI387_007982, partial [Taxus chinensis]
MIYINKIQGFDEEIVVEFTNILNNGEAKVKGLIIRVSDEILVQVIGLPAQRETFPDKADLEVTRREFADNDEEFISDHQGLSGKKDTWKGVSSAGASGGIVTIWNLEIVKSEFLISSPCHVVISFTEIELKNWIMSNIYAPNSVGGRRKLWEELFGFRLLFKDVDWIIGGYFNMPLSLLEAPIHEGIILLMYQNGKPILPKEVIAGGGYDDDITLAEFLAKMHMGKSPHNKDKGGGVSPQTRVFDASGSEAPSKGKGQVALELFGSLKSRGWYLKDVSIVEQLLEEMDQLPHRHPFGRSETEKFVEGKLLDMDLKAIGDKCLPDASAIQRLSHLQGPKIVSLRNILESNDRAIVPNQQHGRLLRICLTDGHSNVIAIEYRPFASFPTETAPGTKVCLETTASVQSGILLLETHSLCILGGRVQSLYEEWEMECKYSGLFRSTLKSPQVQGLSGPPPFERIEISSVQSLHKLQASTSLNKQTVKQTTSFSRTQNTTTEVLLQDATVTKIGGKLPGTRAGQTKDNVGSSKNGIVTTERVRVGYELYKPKASEQRPVENLKSSSESLDKSLLSSNVATGVLSGKQEEEGSAGNLISSEQEANTTLSESNEILGGQPDTVTQKTVLVTEAIPVQNQAAAQKLLKKMSEADSRQDRFGRSRGRHNGRGKRDEAAFLTLDEWEMKNGKTNAISSRNDDISQDAELARQLQTQLDLEAANVRTAHEDEAENIRMSMFNFRNMSDDNQSGSRRPRGRGR